MGRTDCKYCGAEGAMTSIGREDFRVGGTTGIGGMLLGGWNQLGESQLTLEVYVCSRCRHVEMFAD